MALRVLVVVSVCSLFVCMGLPARGQEQPAREEVAKAAVTEIRLRADALAELHFTTLARVGSAGAEAPVEVRPVLVEPARALMGHPGSMLAMTYVASAVAGAENAAGLARAAEAAPERAGPQQNPVPVRELVGPYLRALAAEWDGYRTESWPAAREKLDGAVERVRGMLARDPERLLPALLTPLGVKDPGIMIPVFITTQSPPPGGITVRGRGLPICFVSIEDRSDSEVAEAVLHEAIHAFDVVTERRQPTAMTLLRRSLIEAGVSERDPFLRDAWHTLFFLQAAHTVRAVIDPSHRDLGERSGYYAKVAQIYEIEKRIWGQRLDGKLSLEEALAQLTTELVELHRSSTDSGR